MTAVAPQTEIPLAHPDRIDRALIKAVQGGLPLVARPYDAVAESLGLSPKEVKDRLQAMLAQGIIRRIGVVPNHYRLGYVANGMSVWDVPDERIARYGPRIGALPFVSHCYHRPRIPPEWPYNLFAMVHGRHRTEVEEQVARIARLLGDDLRDHRVLYSRRILKKTGLRLV